MKKTAISTGGRIAVAWELMESTVGKFVRLTWNETDGPKLQSVGDGGFGTVVLKRVAPQAMNGTGDLQYGPNGIAWTFEAPLAFVEAALLNDDNVI